MDKKEVILIVDDIPENLCVLGDMLGLEDYEVMVATNGAAALENARKKPTPDLILLDIMMPDMDGYEVCRRLKARHETRMIPVIFLSALQASIDKVKAFQSGGVDYIIKPFQIEEVLARVRTHLEIRSQRQALEKTNDELRQALQVGGILNRKLIKINEKLRISELLKSRFLSTMRSQIQYPLGSIMDMASQIATNEPAMEKVEMLADRIRAEAFDLDFQIRNIFFAAELEAGDAEPVITPVDVRSILQNAIHAMSSSAHEQSLEICLEVDNIPEAFFKTDAEKLNHIILNLLSNAITFSPADSRIRIGFCIDAGGLTLTVEDEGPGIPEESRDAVFERFRQLEAKTSNPRKGHGLGLSVVKALLDLLGGQIQLSRGSKGGALFTVIIPRYIPPEEASDTSFDGTPFNDDFKEI